ncbi:MAG: aminotransferase class IV [Leptospirales bacterium]
MTETNLIVMNGKLIPAEEASISVFDPGFLYGETLFTTLGVRNASCRFLGRHLKRLMEMASIFHPTSPFSPEQVREGVRMLLLALPDSPQLLRITLTPGHLDGFRLDSGVSGPPSWMIVPIFRKGPDPVAGQSGISTEISPVPALSSRDPRSRLKTGNLFLSRWLRRNKSSSRFELLMKNTRGYLLEGTVSNLFFLLQDDTVLTPPDHWGVLPGVIRSVLIDLLRIRGIPLRWGSLTPRTLNRAKGAFLTNSFIEILPIRTIYPETAPDPRPGANITEPLWRSEDNPSFFSLLKTGLQRQSEEEDGG